jgi:integrase
MEPVGGEQKPRKRVLSFTEIGKLWTACHDPHAYGLRKVYADLILLILTTGCRPGMACGMVEDELFGIEGRPAAWKRGVGAVWDVPEERMKMARPFALPLNPLALEIIERRRALAVNGVLFETPSHNYEDKGKQARVRRLSAICMELSKRLGFKTPFTPHDLRRTASNLLCREFNPMTEVNVLLAHETTSGVMKHYHPENRWNSIESNRKLSERLATMLQEIVGKPTSGGTVVEIRRVA